MTDEILRNGVRHTVTTSLVTKNAVLPQNTFIQEEASALGDSGVGDAPDPSLPLEPSSEFQHTTSDPSVKAAPPSPVTSNALAANDALTTIKSHIRDNIQALKNLAQSDNWQNIELDKLNSNVQGLGTSRSIEENKLYLEKKSIKDNRQKISETTNGRDAANLSSPAEIKATGLSSKEIERQAKEGQAGDNPLSDKNMPFEDSEFQMRVKKLKGHVRNVDSTLQNFDPDK